jgi:DNA mismatch repair protein MutS
MAEQTPMMKQYLEIKEQNRDCILFFRLGDFYEMFSDDAKLASKELDLTLTTRDRSKEAEEQVPMCGIPFHSAESYIARLVARGYKVAICEQMEDPALAKGLVKRDIIRIVTPGTVTESSMLEATRNNYICCVYLQADSFGVSFCDVSTGEFYATVCRSEDEVCNELGRFAPSEALLSARADECETLHAVLTQKLGCCIDRGEEALFSAEECEAALASQFGKTVQELGIAAQQSVILSAGALLGKLRQLQRGELSHIRSFEYYLSGKFMELDLNARRNLELTETLRGKEKRGSLLWVLDKTKTAMGSRMLRSWLEKPLLSPAEIGRRQSAVEELVRKTIPREELICQLREVTDLERVMARIVTGTANCRDLVSLAAGTARLPAIKAALAQFEAPMLHALSEALDPLDDLKMYIDAAIVDDPPFTVREGGMIREGYNTEVDHLHEVMSGGKGMLAGIEAREKEKTGIKNLRVGYNRVFGYYIEVAKGQVDLVPDTYLRKQTLANGERYITDELKELENTILTAKDRITALEYELFNALRLHLSADSARVQETSRCIASLDTLCAFASVAADNGYCRPEVDLSGEIDITAGRHPVVEKVLKNTLFVPNDTHLSTDRDRVAIITGPNMAGKSTYMRQVALIVLMAQIGSFVPAKSARIGIVDRLFTRIGASDDLAAGQSTFMVEMTEVAEILKHATARSLLILDEIGRGTSTFDGMAIARAVLEYTADRRRLGAKTLFATHYHELTAIEGKLEGVKNYNIAAKKRGGDIIFLRKIVPGAADDSYGVEVAKLAGLPDRVVARGREILRELEAGAPTAAPAPAAPEEDDQISLRDLRDERIRARLAAVTVETLTPIEAMNVLYELRQML